MAGVLNVPLKERARVAPRTPRGRTRSVVSVAEATVPFEERMKFFTKEWLNGELTDEAYEAVPGDYFLYLTTLDLPHDVLALSEINLHDGFILDIHHQPESAQLRLRLRCGDLQRGYFDLILDYRCVALENSSLVVVRCSMRVPKVELLYDEMDRVGSRFQHRIILDTHQEVCVEFAQVAIVSQAVSARYD